MYESFWQLAARPFEPNATRDFYYPAETHQGALLKLRYAVENRRGVAALAGAPGTGKTLLIHTLHEQLGDRYQPFIHVVFPQMDGRDLLVYIAELLGAPPDDPPRYTVEESIRRIELVVNENQRQGRHAVLAVDEAHLLWDSGLLETLRLILNLGGRSEPPFTLLLAGQPRLLSLLERIPDLDERIAVKTLIRALSADESASYISHRLKAAGARTVLAIQHHRFGAAGGSRKPVAIRQQRVERNVQGARHVRLVVLGLRPDVDDRRRRAGPDPREQIFSRDRIGTAQQDQPADDPERLPHGRYSRSASFRVRSPRTLARARSAGGTNLARATRKLTEPWPS